MKSCLPCYTLSQKFFSVIFAIFCTISYLWQIVTICLSITVLMFFGSFSCTKNDISAISVARWLPRYRAPSIYYSEQQLTFLSSWCRFQLLTFLHRPEISSPPFDLLPITIATWCLHILKARRRFHIR